MTKRNRGIVGEIGRAPGSFAVAFLCVFMLCVAFLAASDSLPELPRIDSQVSALFTERAVAPAQTELEAPVRVTAGAVGLGVSVSNPAESSIASMDEGLLKGAARHPDTAYLGQKGTVVLFGHSSSLPVVHNRNFKAFNNIQNLKEGSIVSVYSATREYRYEVKRVYLTEIDSDLVVLSTPTDGYFLTLVTCNNSFGTKTSRYVVEAELVDARLLSN